MANRFRFRFGVMWSVNKHTLEMWKTDIDREEKEWTKSKIKQSKRIDSFKQTDQLATIDVKTNEIDEDDDNQPQTLWDCLKVFI